MSERTAATPRSSPGPDPAPKPTTNEKTDEKSDAAAGTSGSSTSSNTAASETPAAKQSVNKTAGSDEATRKVMPPIKEAAAKSPPPSEPVRRVMPPSREAAAKAQQASTPAPKVMPPSREAAAAKAQPTTSPAPRVMPPSREAVAKSQPPTKPARKVKPPRKEKTAKTQPIAPEVTAPVRPVAEPPKKLSVTRSQDKIPFQEEAAPAVATPAPEQAPRSSRRPRRARLRLTRIDPWSVMKTAFLLSVALGVVTFVATFMVWSVLDAAGVWESINSAVASIVEGDNNASTFDVRDYVGMSRVLGFTLVVSMLDVVLMTAIATLTVFLYNLAAALLGGIEVTLTEDER